MTKPWYIHGADRACMHGLHVCATCTDITSRLDRALNRDEAHASFQAPPNREAADGPWSLVEAVSELVERVFVQQGREVTIVYANAADVERQIAELDKITLRPSLSRERFELNTMVGPVSVRAHIYAPRETVTVGAYDYTVRDCRGPWDELAISEPAPEAAAKREADQVEVGGVKTIADFVSMFGADATYERARDLGIDSIFVNGGPTAIIPQQLRGLKAKIGSRVPLDTRREVWQCSNYNEWERVI